MSTGASLICPHFAALESVRSRFLSPHHFFLQTRSPVERTVPGTAGCTRLGARTLGVLRSERAGILSPDGGFSPNLGTWPIQSTRFKCLTLFSGSGVLGDRG